MDIHDAAEALLGRQRRNNHKRSASEAASSVSCGGLYGGAKPHPAKKAAVAGAAAHAPRYDGPELVVLVFMVRSPSPTQKAAPSARTP